MSKKTKGNNSAWLQRVAAHIRGASLYARAFFVIALAFFIFGICTLGSLNGTGKSLTIPAKAQVTLAYDILEKNRTIGAVYVNVGTVYSEPGSSELADTMRVSMSYYNESTGSYDAWGSTSYVANVYSKATSSYLKNNANYNWIALTTSSLSTSRIQIHFAKTSLNSAAGELNEVVFVDEAGVPIKAKFNLEHSVNVLKAGETVTEENAYAVREEDVAATLDAQNSFRESDSRRYNFTQNEEYILESIRGIEQGRESLSNAAYTISEDYNSFGILVYWFFTRIFGMSTFGLRLPSFLATFGVFILLYFFGKRLFKSEKWGLVCSVLFGIGGMFFTVGTLGTPAALALLAVVASIYCMYLFYANGIDGKRPIRTALPVLFSGLCFGAAIATTTLAAFPCILSAVIFVFGILRVYKSYRYNLYQVQSATVSAGSLPEETGTEGTEGAEKTDAADSPSETEKKETPEERKLKADYAYRIRVACGFLVAAFIAFPVLLLALSGLPTYTSFVRHYVTEYSEGASYYIAMLQKGLSQCFAVGDITTYTAGNAGSAWGWLISLKGATLFGTAITDTAETVAQVNAQTNILMTLIAAASFVAATVYVVAGAIVTLRGDEMENDKKFRNVTRAYIGILVGAVLSFVPYLWMENVSALQSNIFSFFYVLFIPLLFYILEPKAKERKGGRIAKSDILLIVLLVLLVVVFALTMPMYFGWEVSVTAAKAMFNWNAFLSNGFYGLVTIG